ncbi:MAG: hypothetical protein OXC62_04380 [Aestuariivita sp.]|nr:hypothetical protein [Aestuariivita sp.]
MSKPEISVFYVSIFERRELRETIEKIYTTACQENWDSEGASAIISTSRNTALSLVGLLPQNMNEPEISSTPHGEIDFDWINDGREMLTLSICPDGSLAWSAQYEHFTCQGDSPWKQELSCPLECCLQHFCQD